MLKQLLRSVIFIPDVVELSKLPFKNSLMVPEDLVTAKWFQVFKEVELVESKVAPLLIANSIVLSVFKPNCHEAIDTPA